MSTLLPWIGTAIPILLFPISQLSYNRNTRFQQTCERGRIHFKTLNFSVIYRNSHVANRGESQLTQDRESPPESLEFRLSEAFTPVVCVVPALRGPATARWRSGTQRPDCAATDAVGNCSRQTGACAGSLIRRPLVPGRGYRWPRRSRSIRLSGRKTAAVSGCWA